MEITVNGVKKEIATGFSLLDLALEQLGDKQNGVAIAINQQVISREQWNSTEIVENDSILIIKATQGG